jgi:hypothetical protein
MLLDNANLNMIDYLETNISEISDPDYQLMVETICICVLLDPDEFQSKTLSFLFRVMIKDGRKISLDQIATRTILDKKIRELQLDSSVYKTCNSLARLNGHHIEHFSGSSVSSLLHRCHKFYKPRRSKTKGLSSYIN